MRVELFGMLQNQSRLKRNKKLTNLRVSLACGQLFEKEMLAGGRPCSLQGSLGGAISLSFILISLISAYFTDFSLDFTGLIAISVICIAISLFSIACYFIDWIAISSIFKTISWILIAISSISLELH